MLDIEAACNALMATGVQVGDFFILESTNMHRATRRELAGLLRGVQGEQTGTEPPE